VLEIQEQVEPPELVALAAVETEMDRDLQMDFQGLQILAAAAVVDHLLPEQILEAEVQEEVASSFLDTKIFMQPPQRPGLQQ